MVGGSTHHESKRIRELRLRLDRSSRSTSSSTSYLIRHSSSTILTNSAPANRGWAATMASRAQDLPQLDLFAAAFRVSWSQTWWSPMGGGGEVGYIWRLNADDSGGPDIGSGDLFVGFKKRATLNIVLANLQPARVRDHVRPSASGCSSFPGSSFGCRPCRS
jgi:hypothetical protein